MLLSLNSIDVSQVVEDANWKLVFVPDVEVGVKESFGNSFVKDDSLVIYC